MTARDLRRNATPAEIAFWEMVRDRKLNGYRFYRQYPIEFEIDGTTRHFIADFYCRQKKLVVEIDGGVHEGQQEYDRYRTFIITRLGMKVVRFSNDEVITHANDVLEYLSLTLNPSP